MKSINKIIANKLSLTFANHNIIDHKYQSVYSYCFEYILDYLQYIFITLLLFHIILDIYWGVFFLIVLLPLRNFCGGYHAPTKWLCTFLSYATVVLFCLFQSIIKSKIATIISISSLIPALIYLYKVTPVDNSRKHFTSEQRNKMKHYYILFGSFLLFLFILLLWFQNPLFHVVTFCVIITAIGVVIERALQRRK